MFDNPKVKAIRRMPEGNNIILIWVMLLTIAGRCNADGDIFLTEKIRYNADTLADELRFSESVVRLALNVLVEYGMIVCQEDAFYIKNWEEYQNIEGMERIREQNRLRKQRERERKKLLPAESHGTSHVTVTQSHATDKESFDSYSYSESQSKSSSKSNSDYTEDFEIFWNEYPRKVGKKEAFRAFKKANMPVQVLLSAVREQKQSTMWTKEGGRYIPNPATWLNQGRWDDKPIKLDNKTKDSDGFYTLNNGIKTGNQWLPFLEEELNEQSRNNTDSGNSELCIP